jgi:glucose/arabinose dehydrogenase
VAGAPARRWIRRLDVATRSSKSFITGISAPVDVLVTPSGDLLYLARGDGTIHRVSYAGA